MPATRYKFITPGHRRFFVSLLIFVLTCPPFGYSQQPQQPTTTRPRILVQEDPKPETAKPSTPQSARPELVLQTGVTAPVYNAAFSPDGRLLASMDMMGKSIKLWEVSTGRELCAINMGAQTTMTWAINSAFAFSSDSLSLFSVSGGTLRQWDARTGREIRSVDLNQGKSFGSASFSADARVLATLNEKMSLLSVWDVESGRKLQELRQDPNNNERSEAFALSPDGKTLAINLESNLRDGKLDAVMLTDVASGRVTRTIRVSEQKSVFGTVSTSPIRGMRFSPDGRSLALAFYDTIHDISKASLGQMPSPSRMNKIRIWEVSSGRELINLDAGTQRPGEYDEHLNIGRPYTFAFSDDNRQCAMTTGKTIRLVDPVAGRNLATISGHDDEVIALGFSADGKLLVTTSRDFTVKIWDVSGATTAGRVELVRTLSGMAMPVDSAAFSGDGRALAVSGAQAVRVWELNTGAALRTITMPALARDMDDMIEPPRRIFSAGGQLFAAQSDDNEIKLWETRSGRELKSFPLSQGKKFVGGSVSPDGKWVALAEGGKDSKRTSGATNQSASPASPTQPSATQSMTGLPQIFNTPNPATQPVSTGDPKKDRKAAEKAAKEQIKEMKKQQSAMMEKMARDSKKDKKDKKGQPQMQIGGMDLSQLQKISEQAQKAAESGDLGKMMEMMSQVTGGIPGMAAIYQPSINVKLWDVNTAGAPRSLPEQMAPLISSRGSAFAFNHDSSLLASSAKSRSIKINEVASGRELFTLTPERCLNIDSLAWSADGRMLSSSQYETRAGVNLTNLDDLESYTGLFSFSIRLWDAATGRPLQTMAGHTANVYATAFSPDGRLLASGGDDAVVKLWETATVREVATLNGHSLGVNVVAFSSDGKLLVSGSDDGSTRLWDVKTGETLATLVSLNRGADWLVVTPDGLFDGTPGAWGQILWRFSPNNIFDVAPVEIFFNDFFYPGLLSDIASGKRPRAAQGVEQKDRRQPIVNIARADGQGTASRMIKLKIEISEPAAANQTAPAGARDVRLFRNGTLVKAWRGDALKGQKQASLETEIPIVAGENRLVAYAFNRDGVKSPDAMMTITGDASLRRKGVLYVIACGVNQYANAQYNLKYAVADATSFAEEVRMQQMKLQEYERVEVIPLLDREATKANILLALKRLSNDNPVSPAGAPPILSKIQPAQPEDAVLIFFAGHGTARGARFYLIPHDLGYTGARNALTAEAMKTILARSISDQELEAVLEGVDTGQLLFVLDACNSGQALEAEEKRRGPMNSSGLAQLAYEKGMYILTAAQSYQAALEAAQLGHGYLTFALIEDGLRKGLADKDPKDGQALAREWFNYAEERVPQMQESEMQTRLLLDFAENEVKAKDPRQRSIQRPRVFYRRELEARPFVVAKP